MTKLQKTYGFIAVIVWGIVLRIIVKLIPNHILERISSYGEGFMVYAIIISICVFFAIGAGIGYLVKKD